MSDTQNKKTRTSDKLKVCNVCNNPEIQQIKCGRGGENGNRFSFMIYMCFECQVAGRPHIVESKYITENKTHEPALCRLKNTNNLLDEALEEIERLNKRIARYQKADEARTEALRASLQPTEAQEHEKTTQAAEDTYTSMGRDEWPSRF
jgi:hypothetical protein